MRKLTLLVVDDDDVIRMIFSRIMVSTLARQDIELVVLEAKDGEAGLTMLLTHLGEIDLIISDCDMNPGNSGFWFFEQAASYLDGTPFWLMSATKRDAPEGVLRFIEKPFDVHTLAALLVATDADEEEDLDPPVETPMP